MELGRRARCCIILTCMVSSTLIVEHGARAQTAPPEAYLSWDQFTQVADRDSAIGGAAPIFVHLLNVPSGARIGIQISWTPADSSTGCYAMALGQVDPGECGAVSLSPEAMTFCNDSTYRTTITFGSSSEHACVEYVLTSAGCASRPATICLTSVQAQDSLGDCIPVDVIGSATLFGGDGNCPLAATSVTPNATTANTKQGFQLVGSGFAAGLSARLLLRGHSVAADSVVVMSGTRALAEFSVPADTGIASVVISNTSNPSDTMLAQVAVQPPPLPYDAHSVIVWTRPGALGLPVGLTRAPVTTALIPQPGLASAVTSVGVDSIVSCSPTTLATPNPESLLQDPSQLNIWVLQLADTNVIAACSALQADSADVIEAHPNAIVRVAETIPSNSLVSNEWWVKNTGQWLGTPGYDTHATYAWDITTGGTPERVVVMDTGVDTNLVDLRGRVELHEGQQDPPFGDYLSDANGHGSSVAGIIGAAGGGAGLIAGLDWNAHIYSSRVMNDYGQALMSDILTQLDGLRYSGYRIFNLSLSESPPLSTSRSEETFFYNAFYSGCFVAVATGNDNYGVPEPPSAYTPYVVPIGAMDFLGERWDDHGPIPWQTYNHFPSTYLGSDFGPHIWMVAAGGRFIETTTNHQNGSYWSVNPYFGLFGFGGTSASAPVAVGAAALVTSIVRDSLDGEDLKLLMASQADPLSNQTGWNQSVGFGNLDVYRTLYVVRPGAMIQRGVATHPRDIAQSPSGTVSVSTWPGIPTNSTFSATRHRLRATVRFAQPYVFPPLVFGKTLGSYGSGAIPSAIYDPLNMPSDMNIKRWNPQADTIAVYPDSVVLETSFYRLQSSTYGSYWWPADTSAARLSYTAIGVPAAALSVGGPAKYAPLLFASPNPARQQLSCEIDLPEPDRVLLAVYDVSGRLARILYSGSLEAGAHHVLWDLRDSHGRPARPGLFYLVRSGTHGRSAIKIVVAR